MSIYQKTAASLAALAEKNEGVLVAFSGGKDSLAVLDLCTRAFKRVIPFYMYVVPGLACVERDLAIAKERWGLEVVRFPHWALFKYLRYGVMCDEYYKKDELPELSLHDIYTIMMETLGVPLVATGARRGDSLWRRRFFKITAHWQNMAYPIRDWSRWEVLSYLKMRKIPIPQQDGTDSASSSGIDLATPSLLWLHDNHPEDFAKLCEWFPYAVAAVGRREFFDFDFNARVT